MFTSGCGVMFGGSRYNARIEVKDHPEAKISVHGKELGKGKANGSFARNEPLIVDVSQDGCETLTRTFDKSFRTGSFILSLFSWGIMGAGIDLATGACYKPDYQHDRDIRKLNDKYYFFTVDYSGCLIR
jgi:hypothetical protein